MPKGIGIQAWLRHKKKNHMKTIHQRYEITFFFLGSVDDVTESTHRERQKLTWAAPKVLIHLIALSLTHSSATATTTTMGTEAVVMILQQKGGRTFGAKILFIPSAIYHPNRFYFFGNKDRERFPGKLSSQEDRLNPFPFRGWANMRERGSTT